MTNNIDNMDKNTRTASQTARPEQPATHVGNPQAARPEQRATHVGNPQAARPEQPATQADGQATAPQKQAAGQATAPQKQAAGQATAPINKNELKKPLSMHMGFSVIYRHGRIMNDRAMKNFSLTGQQMGYLRYINENPGTSQEELAKFMQIDKGAVAKAIKEMEKKGYIRRCQNTSDKRAYQLFPTEKAEEIAKCGKKHSEEFEKQLTQGMTDEEVEQFKILLAKITENMKRIIEGNEII